ncbi:hypothetical protein FOCG_01954 [Fusarium oxysporum f. sp. radicis-lycopersici 26381]|uniref:Uncharacterized protein n=2 Tax=Fusarium oxysporum TaxID=5507 RepID=A0A420QVT6_FUSOX|nr:uncharacterized protein FOBCDRAFT_273275 [Fusarium oxysporum Fo47]EWZ99745.1 hypothetical protein FOWG_00149 [Fusarium oxysporum f. sp. lycopersici MN25]EXL58428.1 hypothetical protein FOCG_01954 [Fusarium oxysporum f. sp. radicis-lycopersici 26381]RKL08872.1 hypothetical protein BFJ68_g9362 [Fusarium oxysporum]EWZ43161.1 hypothetical protein FOZG_07892 [Fusarium oxysporum Fo47]QKD53574.1 hypothetical protein FOBCDRAFT_273275 [Fusarium oxysporum Fo47]
MPSSQKNATVEKKATGPSVPQNPKEHGSKEKEWLRQSGEDEPWRGFTVVATDRKNWQSHVYPAQNSSETWSTQAEVGSQEESSTG